jgi:SAM-dependent methyltransferase
MNSLYPPYFARFYDLIYDKIRSGVDTEYFMKKILEAKGPVLEVGTGTGRFFLEARNKGADIYGIDVSPAMLDILASRMDPKDLYRISEQDIRNFSLDIPFRLIIAPFRVFMHLISTEDQIITLNHIHQNLSPGGCFIFDLYIPDPRRLDTGVDNVMDFEGEYEPGRMLRRFTSSSNDLINQVNHVTMRFEWEEDNKVQSETWRSEMRFFFRYELEYLLQQSNFSSYKIYGDFNESPLSKESKEFVVVCRKGL